MKRLRIWAPYVLAFALAVGTPFLPAEVIVAIKEVLHLTME